MLHLYSIGLSLKSALTCGNPKISITFATVLWFPMFFGIKRELGVNPKQFPLL
jgi:hypothetical protein